jgi:18S rRNA (adenine1779-N6/adenine1780-N6)-dimethyltransferase
LFVTDLFVLLGTWQAQVPVVDPSILGDLAEDESMEVDFKADGDGMEVEEEDGNQQGNAFFKEKCLAVLGEGEYEDKRSSKLTQDDFLRLLALFNKAGIHFT